MLKKRKEEIYRVVIQFMNILRSIKIIKNVRDDVIIKIFWCITMVFFFFFFGNFNNNGKIKLFILSLLIFCLFCNIRMPCGVLAMLTEDQSRRCFVYFPFAGRVMPYFISQCRTFSRSTQRNRSGGIISLIFF